MSNGDEMWISRTHLPFAIYLRRRSPLSVNHACHKGQMSVMMATLRALQRPLDLLFWPDGMHNESRLLCVSVTNHTFLGVFSCSLFPIHTGFDER